MQRFESFRYLCTAVQQRRNEKERHSFETQCLPDSFEVVETYSIDVSFSNSVP